MKSNLERFQMTKLCPFKEKIQRQYLSTNVSVPIQRRSVCIFQVALGSNLLNLPPAHRTFGGDVADGLQQVPRLANAANAEEDLRPAGLTRKGWEGHRRWWTNGLRSFSRPLCRNHRSCPDTMRITEAQRGNRVDGCCYRCSTETNCSQLQTPVIIFSPFCFMFSQCWEMLVQETVNGTFFKKRKEERKEGRSNMTKYQMGHRGTQDIRLRCEGRGRPLLQKSSTHEERRLGLRNKVP